MSMDGQLALGVVAIVTPVAVGGLGFALRNARRNSAMEQRMRDFEADYTGWKREASGKLDSIAAKLGEIDVRVAETKTDVAWIKDAIQKDGFNH